MNEKGEMLEQINNRVASQLAKVGKHLATCEQARAQKWSKLMKAKADADSTDLLKSRQDAAQIVREAKEKELVLLREDVLLK